MNSHHVPVLKREVIALLKPRPNTNFIDGTVGGGGHAEAILDRTAPQGRLLALDVDDRAIEAASLRLRRFGNRAIIVRASYSDLLHVVAERLLAPIDGILLDLGLSSDQLDRSMRGFSHHKDEILDMRYDQTSGRSASELVLSASFDELYQILHEYGELKAAKRIATSLFAMRTSRLRAGSKVIRTSEVVEAVHRAHVTVRRGVRPETLVFQALRIAVNRELDNLKSFLTQAMEILASNGRLVIISYHSLEDRMVKDFFRQESKDCICPPKMPICQCGHTARLRVITRKALRPHELEVQSNPRSRSARLRVAERV